MSTKHQGDKVISFDRSGLVFVFNFNSTKSFTDYRIAAPVAGKYRIVLDSDDKQFGGHGRLDHNTDYFTLEEPFAGRPHSLMVTYYFNRDCSPYSNLKYFFSRCTLRVGLVSCWLEWTDAHTSDAQSRELLVVEHISD